MTGLLIFAGGMAVGATPIISGAILTALPGFQGRWAWGIGPEPSERHALPGAAGTFSHARKVDAVVTDPPYAARPRTPWRGTKQRGAGHGRAGDIRGSIG